MTGADLRRSGELFGALRIVQPPHRSLYRISTEQNSIDANRLITNAFPPYLGLSNRIVAEVGFTRETAAFAKHYSAESRRQIKFQVDAETTDAKAVLSRSSQSFPEDYSRSRTPVDFR